jgi:hypothetical protein
VFGAKEVPGERWEEVDGGVARSRLQKEARRLQPSPVREAAALELTIRP